MENEYKRRGNFKRIYPTDLTSVYNSFFTEQRRNNILLNNYLFKQSMKDAESKVMLWK